MPDLIEPAFVAMAGRSGSTLLMSRLAAHPQIVAERHYPMEFKPFLAAAFTHDERLVSSLAAHGIEDDEPTIRGMLARRPPSAERARAIYRRLAAIQGKSPAYAAEKCEYRYARPALATYPNARLIVLVRDPRAVIVSVRDFDAKRGYRGFFERDGDPDDEVVRKYTRRLEHLTAIVATLPHHLVRYEDLMLSPARTMRGVYDWLGVEPVPESEPPSLEHHRSALSADASIGRWRRTMSPELQALCNERWGSVLGAFGYAEPG